MKKLIYTFLLALFLIGEVNAQCYPDRHTTDANAAWISCLKSENPVHGEKHWLLYDFSQSYDLYDIHFWNMNHPEFLMDGVKDIIIDISQDSVSWTTIDTFSLPRATGSSFYEGYFGPDLGGLSARYILITAINNHGGDCFALSEVKFYTEDALADDFNLDVTCCENDGILRNLTSGMGLGGSYSGVGVSDNGNESFNFDADGSGPGSYSVMYTDGLDVYMGTITVLECTSDKCASCPDCDTYDQSVIDGDPIPTDVYIGSEVNSEGTVPPTNDVEFRARDFISLNEGFQVDESGLFLAEIRACDINLLLNPGFEDDDTEWSLGVYAGAAATLSIESSDPFDGSKYAKVDVTQSNGTGWHVQLEQNGVSLDSTKTYQIFTTVRADQETEIEICMHLDIEPWTTYFCETLYLDNYWKTFNFIFEGEDTVEDNVRFTFMSGASVHTLEFDKLKLTEID